MSYYNQQQTPVGVPPPQGYPPEAYPKDAYPPPGYPPQGYAQGYPQQGYPPQYAPQYAQPPPQQHQSSGGGGLVQGWRCWVTVNRDGTLFGRKFPECPSDSRLLEGVSVILASIKCGLVLTNPSMNV